MSVSSLEEGEGAERPESSVSVLSRRSPRFIDGFVRIFWFVARVWFRPSVRGLEVLPRGPCLLVANHSGFGAVEAAILLCAWWKRFGRERPAVGLAHDLGFVLPVLRFFLWRMGGIPARQENARQAFQGGYDVLVFPGGDLEALRPFRERQRVRFEGRTGFVRAALAAKVPIVPIAISGSHAQFTFLPGGERIAQWTGLRRLQRLKTAPLWPGLIAFFVVLVLTLGGALGWPWLLLAYLVAFVPNPTRIDVQFLPVVPFGTLESLGPEQAAEQVRLTLENELRRTEACRLTPWGGTRRPSA